MNSQVSLKTLNALTTGISQHFTQMPQCNMFEIFEPNIAFDE
jgi:hypothetical protein